MKISYHGIEIDVNGEQLDRFARLIGNLQMERFRLEIERQKEESKAVREFAERLHKNEQERLMLSERMMAIHSLMNGVARPIPAAFPPPPVPLQNVVLNAFKMAGLSSGQSMPEISPISVAQAVKRKATEMGEDKGEPKKRKKKL